MTARWFDSTNAEWRAPDELCRQYHINCSVTAVLRKRISKHYEPAEMGL